MEWFGDLTAEVAVRVLPPGGPTTVPDVVGLYKNEAGKQVVDAALVPRFTPPPMEPKHPYVAGVSPKAGTTVDRGSTVTMQLKPGPPP